MVLLHLDVMAHVCCLSRCKHSGRIHGDSPPKGLCAHGEQVVAAGPRHSKKSACIMANTFAPAACFEALVASVYGTIQDCNQSSTACSLGIAGTACALRHSTHQQPLHSRVHEFALMQHTPPSPILQVWLERQHAAHHVGAGHGRQPEAGLCYGQAHH